MAFNDKYDGLMSIVKEATETGIKFAGIDVPLYDLGCAIQEVFASSDKINLNGKNFKGTSITAVDLAERIF